VTFGCLRPGLLVGAGARHAGLVELVDIGLGPELPDPPLVSVTTLDEVALRWPRPGPDDDKYTRGVVGIAAGSAVYPASAVLAMGGALAGPAGYVRYAVPAADAVRAHHPEAVCTERVADAGRVQAWVVGSGLGTDDAARSTMSAAGCEERARWTGSASIIVLANTTASKVWYNRSVSIGEQVVGRPANCPSADR